MKYSSKLRKSRDSKGLDLLTPMVAITMGQASIHHKKTRKGNRIQIKGKSKARNDNGYCFTTGGRGE